MRVVAFVNDLMDRSRFRAAFAAASSGPASDPPSQLSASSVVELEFVAAIETITDPTAVEVVFVDLRNFGASMPAIRAAAPAARIVAFGPHVDDAAFADARRDGADLVLARSRLFRDIRNAALGPVTGG